MIKEFGKTALVAAMVLAFVAAPFAGALCTMSCADGGSACCCTAGVPGEATLAKPSCCEGEISGSSATGIDGIMAADSGRTVFPSLSLPQGEAFASLSDGRPAGESFSPVEELPARSSPIFLLTESFLI